MKIFLSWSGKTSRRIAEVFNEWLPCVLQAIDPYFSPDGLDKGSRWSIEIANELDDCNIGLLFLTKDNLEAPWIMFEAGSLAKKLDSSRVSPLLFGVSPSDLKGPLVQFQATSFTKEDIHKLVANLNQRLDTTKISTPALHATFEKWWPELDKKVGELLQPSLLENVDSKRPQSEILEELLEIARSEQNRRGQEIAAELEAQKHAKAVEARKTELAFYEDEVRKAQDRIKESIEEKQQELEGLDEEIELKEQELKDIQGGIARAEQEVDDYGSSLRNLPEQS